MWDSWFNSWHAFLSCKLHYSSNVGAKFANKVKVLLEEALFVGICAKGLALEIDDSSNLQIILIN